MKKIILLLSLIASLLADDVVVYKNEYNVLKLDKKVRKLLIGNREMINVSLLSAPSNLGTTLKIFGKKSGNTSILIKYRDGSIVNFHVYVNENLGFVQKMVNMIEPTIELNKVGESSTVIKGTFSDPHNKKRVYSILESAGIDLANLMDLTKTAKVNKMVRTKLYLVEINNQKAKDLGGVTGMGFFNEYLGMGVNYSTKNVATFSGWLLDNTGAFTSTKGNSINSTLSFLQENGIGKILDDTVLMTTEDENASFRVGGDVYIPIGMTQNIGLAPTIRLEKKEYGLFLTLKSQFMEKDGYMHINVEIKDSEFDTNEDHDVQLGPDIIVPSFLAKNIKTNVVVKSGQVIALGGRLHTETVEQEEKVPFLGDIPLIGELFTHTTSGKKENDLLFFLVPEIIDANEKVDNTHFYKEFKKEASTFHIDSIESNATKNNANTKKVHVKEKVQVKKRVKAKAKARVKEHQKVIIEMEENKSSLKQKSASLSKEIKIEDKKSTVKKRSAAVAKEIKAKSTKSISKKSTLAEKKIKTIPAVDTYSVNTTKIFLRSKPSTGIQKAVWQKGHKFTASKKKIVDGKTWLKVEDNCYEECVKEARELWISKKYVDKV